MNLFFFFNVQRAGICESEQFGADPDEVQIWWILSQIFRLCLNTHECFSPVRLTPNLRALRAHPSANCDTTAQIGAVTDI